MNEIQNFGIKQVYVGLVVWLLVSNSNNNNNNVRIQFLTAASINMTVFWDVAPWFR
jgi:hypothetical protein